MTTTWGLLCSWEHAGIHRGDVEEVLRWQLGHGAYGTNNTRQHQPWGCKGNTMATNTVMRTHASFNPGDAEKHFDSNHNMRYADQEK